MYKEIKETLNFTTFIAKEKKIPLKFALLTHQSYLKLAVYLWLEFYLFLKII